MKLEDAPGWLQSLIVEKAPGFLEHDDAEFTMVDEDTAKIRVGEFTYTASRKYMEIG